MSLPIDLLGWIFVIFICLMILLYMIIFAKKTYMYIKTGTSQVVIRGEPKMLFEKEQKLCKKCKEPMEYIVLSFNGYRCNNKKCEHEGIMKTFPIKI